MVIPGLGKIGSKIHATPAATAGDTGNAELTDEVRALAWIGWPFALFSLILIPWTVYLAGSLPSEQVSTNYDSAWAGFDVMLMLALAATAYFALRRPSYLPTAAGATATLLVVDAWFDVLTTPGVQRIESILLAVFVELPLAAFCVWLSWRTQQLEERRIAMLERGRGARWGLGRRSLGRRARSLASRGRRDPSAPGRGEVVGRGASEVENRRRRRPRAC